MFRRHPSFPRGMKPWLVGYLDAVCIQWMRLSQYVRNFIIRVSSQENDTSFVRLAFTVVDKLCTRIIVHRNDTSHHCRRHAASSI